MRLVIALAMTLLGAEAYRALWGERLPGIVVVGAYIVLYLLIARLRKPRVAKQHVEEPDPDYSHLPTSGPIGRFGQRGLLAMWSASGVLALLNPRQAVQIVRQIRGNMRLVARERRTGDDGCGYRTQVAYALPVQGDWLVYNGGMTPKTSHSWDVLGQRFALDMVQADPAFRRHRGRGTKPEEYFCHGQPVLAAADGEVVAVCDGIGPARFLGWGICDFTARHFAGTMC